MTVKFEKEKGSEGGKEGGRGWGGGTYDISRYGRY